MLLRVCRDVQRAMQLVQPKRSVVATFSSTVPQQIPQAQLPHFPIVCNVPQYAAGGAGITVKQESVTMHSLGVRNENELDINSQCSMGFSSDSVGQSDTEVLEDILGDIPALQDSMWSAEMLADMIQ